jgi:hypothetical protein
MMVAIRFTVRFSYITAALQVSSVEAGFSGSATEKDGKKSGFVGFWWVFPGSFFWGVALFSITSWVRFALFEFESPGDSKLVRQKDFFFPIPSFPLCYCRRRDKGNVSDLGDSACVCNHLESVRLL